MRMKNRIVAVAVCGLLAAAGAVLLAGRGAADWEEEDGSKMHFPQLPDPQGWDVNATWPLNILADDWNCTESGPVTDIHFWGSWRHDLVGDIHGFYISIWSNNPGDPQGGIPSFPEALLWEAYITDFKAIDAGFGAQSWYEPEPDILYPGDHEMYFQYNIINITDPFWQEYGTIYWLSISADISTPGTFWGWKTSIYTNTYDDAFWGYYDPTGGGITWVRELYIDPPTVSMDLAFVITGTPCCNKDWNYWSGWPNIWLIPGGNVGIGTATPTDKLDVNGNVRVRGSTEPYLFFVDANNDRIGIGTNSPNAFIHALYGGNVAQWYEAITSTYSFWKAQLNFMRARGTVGSKQIVQNGDWIGSLEYKGWDGATWRTGARLYSIIDGTPGSNDMPARFIFATTPDGSGNSQDRITLYANNGMVVNEPGLDYDFRIESTGNAFMFYIDAGTNNVGIGKPNPSKTLDINGDIMVSGDYYSSDGSQGWTGTFTNGDGNTVTVKNGIITGVS